MPSIKDVAREAGVSTATVSHVINNTRFVSDEVRARVRRAIEECRYYPNAHARSLASGRSQIIGLVISDITNPFFPELVKSIEAAAFEHRFDVVLSNTNYDSERTSHYVRRYIERKVTGVAVMTSELNQELVEELAQCKVPAVFLDIGKTGLHMNNLHVDYEEGIKQAILHLAELGHRRIAYISGAREIRSSRRRLEAFQQNIKQLFPTEPELIFHGNFKVDGGQRAAQEILSTLCENLPTAVVSANDLTAIGAINEFREAGLGVPDDISVVGFDDIPFASLTVPSLTTVNVPLKELGRYAVEVLAESSEDLKKQGVEIRISTHLVVRNSTAPVKARAANRSKRKGSTTEKQFIL